MKSPYKLSELPLGAKATICSTQPGHENYKFTGKVYRRADGKLWLYNDKDTGYFLEPQYNALWDVVAFEINLI